MKSARAKWFESGWNFIGCQFRDLPTLLWSPTWRRVRNDIQGGGGRVVSEIGLEPGSIFKCKLGDLSLRGWEIWCSQAESCGVRGWGKGRRMGNGRQDGGWKWGGAQAAWKGQLTTLRAQPCTTKRNIKDKVANDWENMSANGGL